VTALTARITHADVGCDQLAVVTEVYKGMSALLNLKKLVVDAGGRLRVASAPL
jgi:hypothetical protein